MWRIKSQLAVLANPTMFGEMKLFHCWEESLLSKLRKFCNNLLTFTIFSFRSLASSRCHFDIESVPAPRSSDFLYLLFFQTIIDIERKRSYIVAPESNIFSQDRALVSGFIPERSKRREGSGVEAISRGYRLSFFLRRS